MSSVGSLQINVFVALPKDDTSSSILEDEHKKGALKILRLVRFDAIGKPRTSKSKS